MDPYFLNDLAWSFSGDGFYFIVEHVLTDWHFLVQGIDTELAIINMLGNDLFQVMAKHSNSADWYVFEDAYGSKSFLLLSPKWSMIPMRSSFFYSISL
jgi:hypothetical protein